MFLSLESRGCIDKDEGDLQLIKRGRVEGTRHDLPNLEMMEQPITI